VGLSLFISRRKQKMKLKFPPRTEWATSDADVSNRPMLVRVALGDNNVVVAASREAVWFLVRNRLATVPGSLSETADVTISDDEVDDIFAAGAQQ
jgi:hypothetical protein